MSAICVGTSLVLLGVVGAGLQSASAIGVTRFVASTGSDTANTCLVSGSPCLTLGHALAQAAASDTIQLDPGTYLVSHNPSGTANVVPNTLDGVTIESNPSGGTAANTIIDATGKANGLVVHADNVTVKNLTFRNADRAGISVGPTGDAATPPVNNLMLSGDAVTSNDLCWKHPSASDCPAQNSAAIPAGPGIDLLNVVDSTLAGNTVTGNWGGIVIGLGHGDTISGNNVSDNGTELSVSPAERFGAAGIYVTGLDNTISGNTINGNGSHGVFLFAGGNRVTGNTVNENWGAGVAIETVALLGTANGNVITGNHVSRDALHGGPGVGLGGPGDLDARVVHTTGILVLSFFAGGPPTASPITGTVITGNTISDVFYGVWMSVRTPKANVSGNTTSVVSGGAAILVQRRTIVPIVGIARTLSGHGYWEVQSDGTVFPFGDAGYFGSLAGMPLTHPVVGIAATPSGHGYWLAASDGGVFSFGDAGFHGSTGAIHLNQPIVGMAAGPSGNGYWLVASDGGVFSFGTAKFHGSTGAIHLNQPIVGMTAGPSSNGYWLAASDGGVFSFGTAKFHGSMGAIHLNQRVVGMTAGPSGNGYWLVASDGGVFSFGTAKFHGSTGAIHLNQPVVGMSATPTGLGYWLGARDGGIFAFPDAHYFGSEPANS